MSVKQEFVVTEDISKMQGTVHVIDGMDFFPSLSQSIPDTIGEVEKKVLHTLPQRSPMRFITDTYKPDSIWSFERDRRERTNDPSLLKGPSINIYHQTARNFWLVIPIRKHLPSFFSLKFKKMLMPLTY